MRLIDVDDYGIKMNGVYPEYWDEVLDDMPTVDAVPVVRCKDCKWYNPKGDDPYFLFDFWCDNDDGMWNPSPESYCSFGERREDG